MPARNRSLSRSNRLAFCRSVWYNNNVPYFSHIKELQLARKIIIPLVLVLAFTAGAQPPAFPGAEGFGSDSVGGRGGQVLEVTNLDNNGPGSLRAAIDAAGPRIVVFRVSGTIALQSSLNIRNPYITIAGQTAPGDGICIRNYPLNVRAHHVIIRYIRIRLGNEKRGEYDSVWVGEGHNIILDHCSASWAIDETLSATNEPDVLGDVTVQWCMITESLNNSTHVKGRHGYGSLNRGGWGNGYSFHHNLYAHHKGRNPFAGNYNSNVADPCGFLFDFRNNVVYNWGSYAGHNSDPNAITRMNFIGNYYKTGPNSANSYAFWQQSTNVNIRAFFSGNWMNSGYPADPWSLVRFDGFSEAQKAAYKLAGPVPVPPVETDDAQTAYNLVIADAGAAFPVRDEADERVINSVMDGTGGIINCVDANDFYFPTGYAQAATSNTITLATSASDYDDKFNGWQIEILSGTGSGQPIRTVSDYVGSTRLATISTAWSIIPDTTSEYGLIVDCSLNAGGYPLLQSATPPDDSDHDGVPDYWELWLCLDPGDPDDSSSDRDGDGYTNIEEYINWLPTGLPMPVNTNLNCDDTVDFYDFSEFAAHYRASSGEPGYQKRYDFNDDDEISLEDLAYIVDNWLWVSQ